MVAQDGVGHWDLQVLGEREVNGGVGRRARRPPLQEADVAIREHRAAARPHDGVEEGRSGRAEDLGVQEAGEEGEDGVLDVARKDRRGGEDRAVLGARPQIGRRSERGAGGRPRRRRGAGHEKGEGRQAGRSQPVHAS